MTFAKIEDVKAGSVLTLDGGFTCLPEGATVVTKQDEDGELYFECSAGRHYLDGQIDGDMLTGLWLTPAPKSPEQTSEPDEDR
jgi:hypothetical protein